MSETIIIDWVAGQGDPELEIEWFVLRERSEE